MHLRPLLLVAAAAVVVGACSTASPASPYATVAAETLASSDPIPDPVDDVVVTLSGAIDKTNDGEALALDMATIERMGLVSYDVHDPWLDEDLTFTGVLLSDFLDTVGASATATTLRITALDDYQVDLAVGDVRRWPILLATMTNGGRMAIVDKGPTRIVFPYGSHPEIDQLRYKDLWIWQIKTIEVL